MSARKRLPVPRMSSGSEDVYALKALQRAHQEIQAALGELSKAIKERPLSCAFCGKGGES